MGGGQNTQGRERASHDEYGWLPSDRRCKTRGSGFSALAYRRSGGEGKGRRGGGRAIRCQLQGAS